MSEVIAAPADLRQQPSAQLRRWGLPGTKPTSRVMAALRAMFLSSSRSPRPPRYSYPPRFYPFLEDAAIERGMHRP